MNYIYLTMDSEVSSTVIWHKTKNKMSVYQVK